MGIDRHLITAIVVATMALHQAWQRPSNIGHRDDWRYPPSKSLGFAWTRSAWTANDAKYKQARVELNKLNSVELQKRMQTYGTASDAAPTDSLVAYRWGCAAAARAKIEALRGESIWQGNGRKLLGSIVWRLARATDPHSYECARLRFALEARQFAFPDYIPLARRLAAKDPSDTAARQGLAYVLAYSGKVGEIDEGIAIADGLLKESPGRLPYLNLRAFLSERRWMVSHRREDALKSIDLWKKVRSLAPQGSQTHQDADAVLRLLEGATENGG